MPDGADIRRSTEDVFRAAGIDASIDLPLLDNDLHVVRTVEELAQRIACLQAAIAVAFDQARARLIKAWVAHEGLEECLTRHELSVINCEPRWVVSVQWCVEDLFALCWAGGLVEKFDEFALLPDDLVSHLPSIRSGAGISDYVNCLRIRTEVAITQMLDRLYCAHAILVRARLVGRSEPRLPEEVVVAGRRRALEWLLSSEKWDEVSLDT